MRPVSPLRPIGREPSQSRVVATDGDVRAATNGSKLLAVLEDAAAYGLLFDLSGSAIFVGHGDEVINVEHVGIIGKLTATVNGFLTDGKNLFQRSKYRAC